ncbi:GNAT family N-acetyltransferase [Kitasatospora aureofaciens]|uniref:GNAT family N-acetyltransferase n=1 Tax=Kitasatospora aureofaciens TaxID=1894 RepID=UPI0033CC5609
MSASADPAAVIRRLGVADAEPYRAFRLTALRETPTAFTSDYAEERAKPMADTLARLAEIQQGPGVLLGAFGRDGVLVGTAGLRVQPRSQERHKAVLWGMAVARSAGGRGIGGALVDRVLAVAAEDEQLRQVLLTVSEGNEPALRLYTSRGFEVWGREPRAVLVAGQEVAKLHMVRLSAGPTG